jgi:DNA polymerase-3 subunit chi
MTEIDFYLVQDPHPGAREAFICRLVEKAYNLGHSVYIHTTNDSAAAALDDLLWTFRQQSFIPHEIVPDSGSGQESENCPVVLGSGGEPDRGRQVLVNCNAEVPAFFHQFARILEVVDQDPRIRDAGRNRYSFYRKSGYALRYHKIAAQTTP